MAPAMPSAMPLKRYDLNQERKRTKAQLDAPWSFQAKLWSLMSEEVDDGGMEKGRVELSRRLKARVERMIPFA
ncbi:hypothetical protein M0802_005672 [Mischocyttarus mexicanus]|nr:hypothetical protein M0802_005672 [Mischocyttarus mexicanus]